MNRMCQIPRRKERCHAVIAVSCLKISEQHLPAQLDQLDSACRKNKSIKIRGYQKIVSTWLLRGQHAWRKAQLEGDLFLKFLKCHGTAARWETLACNMFTEIKVKQLKCLVRAGKGCKSSMTLPVSEAEAFRDLITGLISLRFVFPGQYMETSFLSWHNLFSKRHLCLKSPRPS